MIWGVGMKVEKWLKRLITVEFVVIVVFASSISWAPHACDLKIVPAEIKDSNAFVCFEFWLNRYQTMLSGLLALIAGSFAYFAARSQIKSAESLEENRRQAEEVAARARLSLALSDITSFAEKSLEILKTHLENHDEKTLDLLPNFPASTIAPLQNCIRFASKDKAKSISNLISLLQVFKARLRRKDNPKKAVLYIVK